jgi:hypothetical protein
LKVNSDGRRISEELWSAAAELAEVHTVSTTIAVLHYGSGFPQNRLAGLQASLGIIPFPTSTAWDVLEHGANRIHPVFSELIRQAGQGQLLHNDDTSMKVLVCDALSRNFSEEF